VHATGPTVTSPQKASSCSGQTCHDVDKPSPSPSPHCTPAPDQHPSTAAPSKAQHSASQVEGQVKAQAEQQPQLQQQRDDIALDKGSGAADAGSLPKGMGLPEKSTATCNLPTATAGQEADMQDKADAPLGREMSNGSSSANEAAEQPPARRSPAKALVRSPCEPAVKRTTPAPALAPAPAPAPVSSGAPPKKRGRPPKNQAKSMPVKSSSGPSAEQSSDGASLPCAKRQAVSEVSSAPHLPPEPLLLQ
jgi:hypothetical protein